MLLLDLVWLFDPCAEFGTQISWFRSILGFTIYLQNSTCSRAQNLNFVPCLCYMEKSLYIRIMLLFFQHACLAVIYIDDAWYGMFPLLHVQANFLLILKYMVSQWCTSDVYKRKRYTLESSDIIRIHYEYAKLVHVFSCIHVFTSTQ